MKAHAFALSLISTLVAGAGFAGEYDTIKAQAGEDFFHKECYRCHSVDADRASYGPILEGVLGRAVGTVDGYPYSEALSDAGFVWTEGALRAWMEDNDALVPGTKMRHVGITDPTVQDFIVSYLATLTK
ncbi:c-type cytochrome [Pseudoprimorskyibacter insulae]|uniref:Cytochrome c2 n=1 Tax=Pseudoprimorskyibacter insulae TaxID=1695997 RepID=A0A2R8B0N8_9RHOB|nr:c-type cytochrome [Pseudoprimorskyibacter insulae]SPF81694.1 Cytochrome c2 [Pseudoprimorskyibacter insulae]